VAVKAAAAKLVTYRVCRLRCLGCTDVPESDQNKPGKGKK
jgi:hypothetical protein